MSRLRVAAISFLNPAPLMWDFEHAPASPFFAIRYELTRMEPSACAANLLSGDADLGLIPVAALTPALDVVPGCTIASLAEVRSILLLVRQGSAGRLEQVRTIAADTASRSSVAYVEVLFRHFLGRSPTLLPRSADPVAMLAEADAALLIGDPALRAREERAVVEGVHGPCLWVDVAQLWRGFTGLPWVAAVWAVRPEALFSPGRDGHPQGSSGVSAGELIRDLQSSRDHGLAHVEELVREWSPRLRLAPETVRTYLTANIHYHLDDRCLEAILLFRKLAAEVGVLPELPELRLLTADGGTARVAASDFQARVSV